MSKLLIVDDEKNIREIIVKYAKFEGYEIDEAENGMQAIEMAMNHTYDLIIMDVMMPDLDGFSASKEIRKESHIPIIILSARGEEYDRIHGFEVGVDDYVVKPFSPKELMLRVGAVLGRYQSHKKVDHEVYTYEGLVVDFTSRSVKIDGETISMTPKEYSLLFYFIENKGIALTREQLLRDIWGYDFFGDDRTLDTHIKILRKSLGKYGQFIVTLRGVGYRFDAH